MFLSWRTKPGFPGGSKEKVDMTQNIEQKQLAGQQYNSIDLCKFVMAFAVVAIHTDPVSNIQNQAFLRVYGIVVRLAVPFFFLASGYLLAVKMDVPYGSEGDLLRINRHLRSMARMYLTWTAIYAPLAIYRFAVTETRPMDAIILYLKGFFFIGAQDYSWHLWYLLSTVIALWVIGFALKRKKGFWTLLCISLVAGVFLVGISELVNAPGVLPKPLAAGRNLINRTIVNGALFSGLVYIPVGMLLAHQKVPKYIYWLGFLGGFLLQYWTGNTAPGKYFLFVTAISFFGIVEGIRLPDRPIFRKLRAMSAAVYLTHMYVWVLSCLILYGEVRVGPEVFGVTACACLALSALAARKKANR